jgi:hypothetical protein
VPLVELYSKGKATGCGDRYAVEGVAFWLIELTPKTLPGISDELRDTITTLMSESEQTSLEPAERQASQSMLRNLLAHLFLGTFAANLNPLSPVPPPTAPGLTGCDVPLALIYWTSYGVRFVDMWAVRRRPIPQAAPPFSSTPTGEAMLYQFAQHLQDIVGTGELSGLLSALQVRNFFRYLPPCGTIPTTAPGVPGGFVPEIFLQGLAHRPQVFIEGATTQALYHNALYYPPIDLESGEFFWLYRVREQMQAAANGSPTSLLFANGHIPYQGDARFNQARWDYSNIASQPIY